MIDKPRATQPALYLSELTTDHVPPFSLPRDEMRTLGYRVIDTLIAHHESLASRRVMATGAPPPAGIVEPLPRAGTPAAEVLDQIIGDIFADVTLPSHPRFFAKIPAPGNFISTLADTLVSGHNLFTGSADNGAAVAQVELVVLDWLCSICGMPEGSSGVLTNGGSAANLIAVTLARHQILGEDASGARIYFSDETHPSVARAGRIIGLGREGCVRMPCDAKGRLDLDALHQAVRDDRNAGYRPFCVVANAGTNTTGAVDDLVALRDLCDAERLWLHVDGAYAAPASLTERGRTILAGLGKADSITLDPHKWLFQPLEIGSLLVRDPRALEESLKLDDSHLHYDPHAAVTQRNRKEGWYVQFRNRDLQHSRSFKALKLWMAIKVFGADAFQKAIDHGMDLAELAQAELRQRKGWRVLTPAQLAILTFRFEPEGMDALRADLLQKDVAEELEQEGFAALSTTQMKGRTALRICTAHPHATANDVRALVHWLSECAERCARRMDHEVMAQ